MYPIKYESHALPFNTIANNVKEKMVNNESRDEKHVSAHIPILSIDDIWTDSAIQNILTLQQNLVRV